MSNTRRDVLKSIAAASLISPAMSVKAASLEAEAPPELLQRLLSPLSKGEHLGLGWEFVDLLESSRAWNILLRHPGRGEARVAVCFRDGAASGLASTELLDLVLMDGSQGGEPTEESLGRVVMGLSALIRKNESAIPVEDLQGLLSHHERQRRFGPEVL